jgi:hypothetical protein
MIWHVCEILLVAYLFLNYALCHKLVGQNRVLVHAEEHTTNNPMLRNMGNSGTWEAQADTTVVTNLTLLCKLLPRGSIISGRN